MPIETTRFNLSPKQEAAYQEIVKAGGDHIFAYYCLLQNGSLDSFFERESQVQIAQESHFASIHH
jgi:hypothetical protein